MKKELHVDGLTVTAETKRIKHIYLRVLPPDGRVQMSAPLHTASERLISFVRERREWIDRQRTVCLVAPCQYETGETVPLWGEELRLTLRAGRGGVHRMPDGLLLSAPANADKENRARILSAFYREELCAAVERMIEDCMRQSGARASEWRIRDMKTRWGSCNVEKRRIWLNLHLAEKAPDCLRYVLLHELCHLHEHGHGKAFWARMDACCPDWRAIRKRLNGKD